MITHFPTLYDDELFYSLCARYGSRVAYPNAKSLLLDLFNSSTASAVVDLPNRLRIFAEALPTGSLLTADRLINQHTLFPFFSAFLPPKRVKRIREDMHVSSGPAAHMRSGVMGSSVPMPGYLRFCPLCSQEDGEKVGETYWHRLHQLPGIEVCQRHRVFLENSNVGIRAGRNNHRFLAADQAIRVMVVRPLESTNQDHQLLLKIAHDATWLLEHPSLGTSPKLRHNRYLGLLVKRGLATYTGSIHVRRLLKEFTNHYSSDLLKLLHCEFRGSDIERSNWLLRLVRASKNAQHPLYHLLLIQFLGSTAKEFFQMPEEVNFFGEGPWPCLNPAADHYKRPFIVGLQLGKRLRNSRPVGVFNCDCGFAFARTGPDSTPQDRFRIGRMISFGPVWEAKLKELWKDTSLSLSEIGRQLKVDPLTVRKHAARLKLPFLTSGRKSKPPKRSAQLKGSATSAAQEKKQRTYRLKWLSVIRHNPKITLKVLRHRLPKEYAWLLQNDSKWLKENNIPQAKQRHIKSTSSVDWKRRDAEYAVAVRAAALRLKNAPGRPVQMTKTALARAVGAVTLLQQKLHKMPLTTQVLANVVETRVEYAIRRIWWAVKLYCEENFLPQNWQLIQRANVYRLRKVAEIKEAIESAIQKLKSVLHSNERMQTAS